MGKLTFNKTHRMLIKATEEGYNYETVDIDINSGLFKKTTVASKDTKIRVNSEIYGEYFTVGGSHPCTIEDVIRIEKLFNNVRSSFDWKPVEFRKGNENEQKKEETNDTTDV